MTTMIVRALAVQQPWAGLIANGAKKTEWRSWSTEYRGPILIVASQGRNREGTEDAKRRGQLTSTDDARGATLCVVDLVGVVWTAAENLFAWKLAQPRLVPVTPIKGKLNLYNETVSDSWYRHFGLAAKPSSKVSAKPALGARCVAKVALDRQRRKVALTEARKAEYERLLGEWRAAGCPDGAMVREVVRAERRWKGPRP
jgi:hypothetical protein